MKTRDKLVGMFLLIVAGVMILIFTSCSSSQELKTNKKLTSVLIMPTLKNDGIYFRNDDIWRRLVWSFQSNGFNVVNNDSVWNSLIKDGYDIARLTDTQILEISKNYKVDLIISRNPQNNVLEVFDCKDKKFVVYDDLSGIANTDVRSDGYDNPRTRENFYTALVMKVRGLGY